MTMPTPRRAALQRGLLTLLALPGLPGRAAAESAPFKRLAVLEPPFVEHYEVLIAMAPPLARTTLGKLVTGVVSEIDQQQKAEELTAVLDPDRTQLHQQFLLGLADALDAADARVLRVPIDPADNEAALFAQVRERAPQADAIMLANVSGRFVALHGADTYAPSVVVGIKVLPAAGGDPWVEAVFSAGFRSLDPRAVHLDAIDLSERFDNHAQLLAQADTARAALQRGAEAIGTEVARRLMA
jgi:hypothetical protein